MEDIATSILAFRHHVNAIRSHLRKKVTLKNNKDMEEKKIKETHLDDYIGTKHVKAEYMNEDIAVKKGYARKNEDNHEWRKGYHVQYTNPDGSTYDSWSPKDVFERSYKCATTIVDRLYIERNELSVRKQKLDKSLDDEVEQIESKQLSLLLFQRLLMDTYIEVLDTRIALLEDSSSKN